MLAGGDGDMPLPELSHRRAQLPLSMGGLRLGSAVQQRHAAYWSSWADTARALRQLQPGVLATLLRPLLDATASGTPPSTRAAKQAARFLRSEGFPAPTWAKLLEVDATAPADHTTRPAPGERPGWQRTASKALHKRALETHFTELDPTSRALVLSQGGDAASCAFTAFPTSADTRVPDDEFRVMLLRRLRLPPARPETLRLQGTPGRVRQPPVCLRTGGSAGAESWPLGKGSGSHLQGGRCPRRIACRPPRPQPRCARERRMPYRGGRQRPLPYGRAHKSPWTQPS